LCVACTSEELPAPFSKAVAGVYVAGKISYIIFYCHEDGKNKSLRNIIKELRHRGVIFKKAVIFTNNAMNSGKRTHRKAVQYIKIQ